MIRPDGGSLSKSSADDSMEFWHTQFTRNSPKNLHLVQRRVSQWLLCGHSLGMSHSVDVVTMLVSSDFSPSNVVN